MRLSGTLSFIVISCVLVVCTGCFLGLEAAEVGALESVAAEDAAVGFASDEAAVARSTVTGFVDEIALDSRAGGSVRIVNNEIFGSRGRIGSFTANNELFLARRGGGEALAGRLFDGRIWVPEPGGNLVPAVTIRGTTTGRTALFARPSHVASVVRVLEKGEEVEVLAAENGWLRFRSGDNTAWAPSTTILVSLLPSRDRVLRRLGVNACLDYSNRKESSSISRRRAEANFSRAFDLTVRESNRGLPSAAYLSGRRVIVRYSESGSSEAGRVAARLSKAGMNVEAHSVDSLATSICGGDVYYSTTDIDQAEALQAEVIDYVRFGVTSTDRPTTLIAWVKK